MSHLGISESRHPATEDTISVAIVGLGRVASRFDEEPGRTTIWTHAGAYLARSDRFRIVGACEPFSENAAAFRQRCPDVPVVEDIDTLFRICRPALVSVCTPAAEHFPVMERSLAEPSVRFIWCEKPLAGNLAEAQTIVSKAAERNVRILVSHARRWAPLWQAARDHILRGTLGQVRCIRVAMPNRLLTIGSHAVDLAIMLGGEVATVRSLEIPDLHESGEPAVAAMLGYRSGAYGIIQVTGLCDALIVEAEVIGDSGRMTVREDRGEIVIERFVADDRYAGYRRLANSEIERYSTLGDMSPFTAIADEISALFSEPTGRPTCDGRSALEVEKVLQSMTVQKVMAE